MTSGIPGSAALADPRANQRARLEKTAKQLEGVFVQELFKAMRSTVPEGGFAEGNAGEEMFTSMFDGKIAEAAPLQWRHGLSEALVTQLQDRATPAAATAQSSSTIRTPESSR